MAKKVKTKATTLMCGECKSGYYKETSLNRAHDGSYILKTCPHSVRGRFRNDEACDNFVKA